jgi:hypothetical protein
MPAITHSQLREGLQNGSFRFSFRKTNGDMRTALGTLSFDEIPKVSLPTGGIPPNGATSYYDLEKNGWRSVSESTEVWSD